MTAWHLTPRAATDLEDIADYTIRSWGSTQARSYLLKIRDAFSALATMPHLGRACDDVVPGYRQHQIGSHIIFYRLNGEIIDIIRILHCRMDAFRHF